VSAKKKKLSQKPNILDEPNYHNPNIPNKIEKYVMFEFG